MIDKFLANLSQEDRDYINKLKAEVQPPSHRGPGTTPGGVWFGEIQYCPTCKDIMVTSCCACGCGDCLTCNHGYSCVPIDPRERIEWLVPDWYPATYTGGTSPEMLSC